jgi:hypothetical protein
MSGQEQELQARVRQAEKELEELTRLRRGLPNWTASRAPGRVDPNELITALILMIRHCYQLDLVGWGEPLISPSSPKS